MDQFNRIFAEILKHEGTKYTDIKEDRGGKTRYGLTLTTMQQLEPSYTAEQLQGMGTDEAREYYLRLYTESGADRLDLDDQAKDYYFDMYINGGPKMSNMCLQMAINHKISTTDHSQWIDVDGAIGNGTREALGRVGSVSWLDLAIQRSGFFWNNVFKGSRFGYKKSRDPESPRLDQEKFIYGWIKRCFRLEDDGRTGLSEYSRQELTDQLEKLT